MACILLQVCATLDISPERGWPSATRSRMWIGRVSEDVVARLILNAARRRCWMMCMTRFGRLPVALAMD